MSEQTQHDLDEALRTQPLRKEQEQMLQGSMAYYLRLADQNDTLRESNAAKDREIGLLHMERDKLKFELEEARHKTQQTIEECKIEVAKIDTERQRLMQDRAQLQAFFRSVQAQMSEFATTVNGFGPKPSVNKPMAKTEILQPGQRTTAPAELPPIPLKSSSRREQIREDAARAVEEALSPPDNGEPTPEFLHRPARHGQARR